MEKRTASERQPYRILVIEDDAAISRVLQLELEHERYEVDVARDGLAGLEKALKEPDLVILDLMLPRMDGIEVCKRIRAKSRVPIIMLTARDRVPDRVAGLDVANAELAQDVHHRLPADHRDRQHVGDHAAEREADRRRAQRVDERVVPLVAIADPPDERGEPGLHRRQPRRLTGDAAIAVMPRACPRRHARA